MFMKTNKTITISQARAKLAEITQDVQISKTTYEIVRHGQPIAKITPVTSSNTTTVISPEFKKQLDKFTKQYHEDLAKLATN